MPTKHRAEIPPLSPADRLDSWKEIAAHLRRGVRTVQRWEREEALPTHRHLHGKLGTVYAYRSEIDAWSRARRLLPFQLTSIVESSDDAIIGTTLNGVVVTWNKGAEKLYGYTLEETKGRSLSRLDPAGQAETRQVLERILHGERVDHYETARVRKDGRRIHVSLSVSVVSDAAGRHTGLCWIARDVTERKQSLERLLQGNVRLDLLHGISSRVTADMSVQHVIEETVVEVAEQFPSLRVAYSTIDPDGRLLVVHSAEPLGMPPLAGLTTDLKAAPAYLGALLRREPIVVRDVAEDPQVEPLAAAMSAGGTRAILDVPLHHSDALVGLICFDSPEPREWSQHEVETLKEVAGQLSIAIRDARLQQERRSVIEALRVSEGQFRAITETAIEAIVSADQRGSITYFNRSAERMFGQPAEELIGHSLVVLMPERFRDGFRKGLERYLATGRSVTIGRTVEVVGRRRDGSEFPVEVSQTAWATAEQVCFTSVIRDVAERKRVEQRQRRLEAQLAEAQHVARLGSWEWDMDSDTVTWSDELYRIFGLEREALSPTYQGFLERVHPEDQAFVNEIIERARGDHRPFEFDHRVCRPDGSVRILHARGHVLTDAAGRATRMIGTGQDVTERRREEEALRLDRHSMATVLLETVQALVMAVDSEGRIVRFNKSCERSTGYGFDEVRGKALWDVFLPAGAAEPARTFFASLVTSESPRGWESIWVTKDGGQRRIAWSFTALRDDQGSIDCVSGIGIDITQRDT